MNGQRSTLILSRLDPPSRTLPGPWEVVGSSSEIRINPMRRETWEPLSLRLVPRCCAKTRSGKPCPLPQLKGKARWRMHGGTKGSGAPNGRDNGRYQHGMFTCAAIKRRRETRALLVEMPAFAGRIHLA
jgi:hypothetical protein